MKATAPIPFAGSQLGDARHVCAFFHSADEEYGVCFRSLRMGLRADIRPCTLSIRNAVTIIFGDWLPRESIRWPLSGADNWSSELMSRLIFGRDSLIRTGCSKSSRTLQAGTRMPGIH